MAKRDRQQSAREFLEFGLSPPGYSLDFSRAPDEELERAIEVIQLGSQQFQGRPGMSRTSFYDVLDEALKRVCPRFHQVWNEQIEAGPDGGGQPH